MTFQTIVLATDLSEASSTAVRYTQAMARIYHSTVVLVHVIDAPTSASPDGVPLTTAALAQLKRIEDDTRAMGIPVQVVLESGATCERILQAVSQYHADLLVLGARSKTEGNRAALGATARRLLARSHCPIMTIPPDVAPSLPWAGCWLRVLAATDFSPASIRARQCAHQVALRQLILLHVAEDKHECSYCQERMRFLAPFNESHTVPVEHVVAKGVAGDLIADFAQRYGATLIVLGSPEEELGEDDFLKSTVLQVISKVSCPVLCLPYVHEMSAAEGTHAGAALSGTSA